MNTTRKWCVVWIAIVLLSLFAWSVSEGHENLSTKLADKLVLYDWHKRKPETKYLLASCAVPSYVHPAASAAVDMYFDGEITKDDVLYVFNMVDSDNIHYLPCLEANL